MTTLNPIRIGIVILLIIFCYKLWNLEFAHTDDAIWYLASHQGRWNIVQDFAVNQGRIWALVSGTVLYIALYFHGTLIGDLLKVGSFAVFFLLFYKVASIYMGQRLTLLAATLNLSLFALRWEGSIVTTYPAIFWILGSLFLCAVWLGYSYTKNNHNNYLIASLSLFFISLFVHEGATVLLAALFMLSLLANYFLLNPAQQSSIRMFFLEAKFRKLFFASLTIIIFYLLLYIVWRIIFPSTYSGNTLGSFSISRALPVLFSLATSGSVLSDVISPYSVNFSDAVSHDGFQSTYRVFSYLGLTSGDLAVWLYASLVSYIVFFLLKSIYSQHESQRSQLEFKSLAGIVVGILIALLPVLPVAFVGKYQQHYYEYGVHSYAYTALSHFGVTLTLASIIFLAFAKSRKYKYFKEVFLWIVVFSTAVLAFSGYRMNDEIAKDISVEQHRWEAVDLSIKLASVIAPEIQAVYAPRLYSGSWFAVLDTNYWEQYVNTFHKKSVSFIREPIPQIESGSEKISYMDFELAQDGKQMIVYLAPLSKDKSDSSLIADRIIVSIDNPSPSDFNQYVLSFTDKIKGSISVRFSQLDRIGISSSTRTIAGIAAVPASIRVERHSSIQQIPVHCSREININTKVSFGSSILTVPHSCSGAYMLSNGWHPVERSGAWSKDINATLSIPTYGLKHRTLVVNLLLGTYVGLGYSDGDQQISVLLNNKLLATRIDKKGIGQMNLKVIVPAGMWVHGKNLDLTLQVDNTINPAKSLISPDKRELGLHLYSLGFE